MMTWKRAANTTFSGDFVFIPSVPFHCYDLLRCHSVLMYRTRSIPRTGYAWTTTGSLFKQLCRLSMSLSTMITKACSSYFYHSPGIPEIQCAALVLGIKGTQSHSPSLLAELPILARLCLPVALDIDITIGWLNWLIHWEGTSWIS